MQHRTKRDSALKHLVSEFESIGKDGFQVYFEDKEFYQLIEYYEDKQALDKAIDVVDLALEQYQYHSDFYLIKARLHLYLDEYDEALDFIERGEAISPMEIEFKILRAKVYNHLGMVNEALEILQTDPLHDQKDVRVELLMCQGIIHEGARDYNAMYEALKAVLYLDPMNEDALERIWISVELSKNYKDSINFHQKLINKHPYIGLYIS